jgi:hypothetical protein
MIDGMFKYGLTLHWPFDEPFTLYQVISPSRVKSLWSSYMG